MPTGIFLGDKNVKWFRSKKWAAAPVELSAEEQRLTALAEAELAGNLMPDGSVLGIVPDRSSMNNMPVTAGDWTLRYVNKLGLKPLSAPGSWLGRTIDDVNSQVEYNTLRAQRQRQGD